MNKLYPFEPLGTMPLYRSFKDEIPERRVRSGWSRLHNFPEYYPSQTRIYKDIDGYYDDIYEKRKPAVINKNGYADSIMQADLMRWKGKQETLGATQLINVLQKTSEISQS
jgi:hypothetical protein